MIMLLLLLSGLIASAFSISNSVVDISNWQVKTKVDLAHAKEDGIVAVIHKASEGTNYTDPYFDERREQAKKLGLLWGAYHFPHGGNPVDQADHFLKAVGNTEGVLLVLSVEPNPSGANMSPDEAEQYVVRINQKTGRYPMIYGSSSFLNDYNKPHLNNCSLWIASWTAASQPTLPSHRNTWKLWQYTDGKVGGTPRSVNGIGPCDRDKYNGPVEQLKQDWPHL